MLHLNDQNYSKKNYENIKESWLGIKSIKFTIHLILKEYILENKINSEHFLKVLSFNNFFW